MDVHQMIARHPNAKEDTADGLPRCIEEYYGCAQTCTSCADACLAEDMVDQLCQCIQLNLDFADICSAAAPLQASGPDRMFRSFARLSKPAPRLAMHAGMNARSMSKCTNLAGSARKLACAAPKPAATRPKI
ncbi:hypothetical protein [Paracoccus sp. (in: a-proteobacteria)]|uniref:hypothetical protein n=1 Tax=Paracoccus sp. TaxID=267 RepID=UPI00396CA24F